MLKQIKHIELNERVYSTLKELILNRQFAGGQKLDLNQLSNEMQISRTPLKDAVNKLVADGLVEVRPRKGTYIVKIEPKDIKDLMEMREMIETWCVSKLSKQNAFDLANRLEKILTESKSLLNTKSFDYNTFLEQDMQFHKEIVFSNNNDFIKKQYKNMNSNMKISRVFYFESFERSTNGQNEHELIYLAVKKYNLEEASKYLKIHLNKSKEIMVNIIKENGGYI